MKDADCITRYWHYADTQEDTLSEYIDGQQSRLSDELQEILDHFQNIQLTGNVTRSKPPAPENRAMAAVRIRCGRV